jgi:hypothetical protein
MADSTLPPCRRKFFLEVPAQCQECLQALRVTLSDEPMDSMSRPIRTKMPISNRPEHACTALCMGVGPHVHMSVSDEALL